MPPISSTSSYLHAQISEPLLRLSLRTANCLPFTYPIRPLFRFARLQPPPRPKLNFVSLLQHLPLNHSITTPAGCVACGSAPSFWPRFFGLPSTATTVLMSRLEYLIAPERASDDSLTLSLKLTMSHNPDDHFYGCFGARSRRSPNVAGNNPNTTSGNATRRGGLFTLGHGGRTVLPPLHLPFRASRSPGPSFRSHFRREHELNSSPIPAPDPAFLANQYPAQQDATASHPDYNVSPYGQSQWPINPSKDNDRRMDFR